MPSGSTLQPIQHSYLSPSFERAQVVDAMRLGLFSCPPDTPLAYVARMMATYRIHVVVVSALGADHEESTAWGIVSDLDLAALAALGEIDGRTAGDSAATPVVMVASDETLTRAAQLMAEHGTAHVVVVDPLTAQPAGVLSTLDLAQVVATHQPVLV